MKTLYLSRIRPARQCSASGFVLRRSAEEIIEIGRDIIGVKATIGHGNFLSWIEA
jgi:hypothetical protein